MERLSADDIFAFLQQAPVGRLTLYDPRTRSVRVTPLLFAYGGGRIFFISQPGNKLETLRAHPSGVTLQADEDRGDEWISVLAVGRYSDVQGRSTRAEALLLLAEKYRLAFARQVLAQAQAALRQGPAGIRRALSGATVGCIAIERASGRRFRAALTASNQSIHSGLHVSKELPDADLLRR